MPPVENKTWLGKKRGNYKCGNCNHCVTSNREYSIHSFINCNTSFVVYRLECPCGCFYIRRTKRKLKERLAEHKYAIRTSNYQYPMALHYREANHGSNDTLKIFGIEHVKISPRVGD